MNGKSGKEIDTVKIQKELPRNREKKIEIEKENGERKKENREREKKKMERRKRGENSKRDLSTWNGGRENNLKVFPNTVCEWNDVTSSFHPCFSSSFLSFSISFLDTFDAVSPFILPTLLSSHFLLSLSLSLFLFTFHLLLFFSFSSFPFLFSSLLHSLFFR